MGHRSKARQRGEGPLPGVLVPLLEFSLCVCGDLGSWDEVGRAQWGLFPMMAL